MFRPKLLQNCYNHLKLVHRTYLSKQFEKVWTEHVTVPQFDFEKMQLISKRNPIDAYLISGMLSNEPKEEEIRDLCLKQRSNDKTQNTGGLTSHMLINHLVTSNNIDILLAMTSNRAAYGVFFNEYTACLVLNQLLAQQNYAAAVNLIMKILDDKIEHQLFATLSVYALFKYIEQLDQQDVEIDAKVDEKTKLELDTEKRKSIAKSLLQLTAKFDRHDIQVNLKAIALLLTSEHNKLHQLLNSQTDGLCKDVWHLCQAALKKNIDEKSFSELTDKKLVDQQLPSFDEKLQLMIKETMQKEESNFMNRQRELCLQWLQVLIDNLNIDMEKSTEMNKLRNLSNTLAEMRSTEQKLWYFKNEDAIDLNIYSKKVTYPKRWFGKKKKTRSVDENYVPPEVRTRNKLA